MTIGMTKRCVNVFSFTFLLFTLLLLTSITHSVAHSAEPITPPDSTQPKIHTVDLEEDVTLRMGDTVSLKGTDFSAKLVEFSEQACAVPGRNCGFAYSAEVTPEFSFRQGTTICASKKPDPTCFAKLRYMTEVDPVKDRTAIRLRIKTKIKK